MPLRAGRDAAIHGGCYLTEYPLQTAIEIVQIKSRGIHV